jgi:hypothetical protein
MRRYQTLLPAALGAVALMAAFAAPARATIIDYSLNKFVGEGNVPAGPYGTVELNDNNGGPNVQVTVTLAAGVGFVNTGTGGALDWTLKSPSALTITGLDTTNFTFATNNSSAHAGGAGNFLYQIDCKSCGTGGSNPYTGTLSFTIDNVSISQFMRNDSEFYFASDVCTNVTNNSCTQGKTGNVASNTKNDATPAPEPPAIALLGSGLLALGLVRRRSPVLLARRVAGRVC